MDFRKTRADSQDEQKRWNYWVKNDYSYYTTAPHWVPVIGVKVDSNGNELALQKYDQSRPATNMRLWLLSLQREERAASASSLVWNTEDNTLGLVMSRHTPPDGGGVSHQSGIAVVLDGRDMSCIARMRQVGSHSYGKTVRVANDGNFLVLEINDGSSRGVQLFEFAVHRERKRNIIHTKVRHCQGDDKTKQEKCKLMPEYTEISTPTRKFYKGMKASTDNYVRVHNTPMLVSVRLHLTPSPPPPRKVYTSIGHGGPVECYCIVGSGMAPPSSKIQHIKIRYFTLPV